MVAYRRLKTKENFELLALRVVAVAYERLSLTRGSKYSDLTGETFGILENWSLRRGGPKWRFDCMYFLQSDYQIKNFKDFVIACLLHQDSSQRKQIFLHVGSCCLLD